MMFYFDNRQHQLPHIHAQYAEYEALIAIDGGDTLEGDLPISRMKLVQAWLEIHNEELMTDWRLAIQGQKLIKIEPLK
jgi:hypothetical protein